MWDGAGNDVILLLLGFVGGLRDPAPWVRTGLALNGCDAWYSIISNSFSSVLCGAARFALVWNLGECGIVGPSLLTAGAELFPSRKFFPNNSELCAKYMSAADAFGVFGLSPNLAVVAKFGPLGIVSE
jgi:hypothetical protein